MQLQDQLTWQRATPENLRFLRQIGMDSLVLWSPPDIEDGRDRTAEFCRMREHVESHGLQLHVIQMAERCWDEIALGLPGRERKIEAWQQALRGMGAAGIPVLGYVFNIIGHFRTSPTRGRGGAVYASFDYEQVPPAPPLRGETITAEGLWENYAYFLEHVIPVAAEHGVKMALHPDDPPLAAPLGGAPRIMVSEDNFQRAMDIMPGPHNAIEFCQGCFAEMGGDVREAIRRFGSQRKILYVHFRNIRGTPCRFEEVFVDEGDTDMLRAMETYREVGFHGPFMMDHSPGIEGDMDGRQGRAYAAGYIRALVQAVYGR